MRKSAAVIINQSGGRLGKDVIELRLPLKPEYLPVLRMVVGVIAGAVSFSYHDIMYLRVAVSEVFDRAIKNVKQEGWASDVQDLAVRFEVQPGKIEVLITCPTDTMSHLGREEAKESQALLESLMDEVKIDVEADGKSVIRMVKLPSAEKT